MAAQAQAAATAAAAERTASLAALGLPTHAASGGPVDVADLSFFSLAPGTSDVELRLASPFSDVAGSPLDVALVGTRVAVPEPAAGLLAASALAALPAFRRRRR